MYQNALINETSPYLLQHAYNPVNWLPWGDKAFKKAKEENKLVLISIGYSSCHWCHVMEKQSFEDEAIAEIMNKYFVCIKVDREERPDVDKVYMDAVQLLNGNGGWPLNCFALPNGKAVYGGTYYPKESWVALLTQLKEKYKNEPELFTEQAKRIEEGIEKNDKLLIHQQRGNIPIDHDKISKELERYADHKHGGFQEAPKFPLPVVWEYLLAFSHLTNNKDILSFLESSLTHIANGGIYDHAAGGFARYSVDEQWHVPHFEKMLYDNAQLVALYAHMYMKTGNEYFKTVCEECIEFLIRDMRNENGGFYSAYDADSEGEEGKYYVWGKKEFKDITGKNAELLCKYYQVSLPGNWENGKNILHAISNPEDFCRKNGLSLHEFKNILIKNKEKLRTQREKRTPPLLDDKILCSWNALTINGIIEAYKATGNEKYLKIAVDSVTFIKEQLIRKDFTLSRCYKNNKASINGFLDDYAFTIEMMINLYQVTFDEKWLQLSLKLTKKAVELFYDDTTGLFFYNIQNNDDNLKPKIEVMDNVIPSSNATMASNLKHLAYYFGLDEFNDIYNTMCNTQADNLKHIRSFAKWGYNSLIEQNKSKEIVVTGINCTGFRKKIQGTYLPGVLFAGSEKESEILPLKNRVKKEKSLIYICENNVCKLPLENVEEALACLINPKNSH